MGLLTPLFLVALSAVTIPIVIHLIQRERKRVVTFPSLMFIRRIPYQSVRRRRIRHWFLLLMRAAAVALLVLAFARPFFRESAIAAAVSTGGARDVVILLDQSASMGYGDHWQKAQDRAREVIRGLSGDDRATLILFGKSAEEALRATSDRGRLEAAVAAARVTSSATRYGPALKLADAVLSRSALKRREVVLISDFQKTGWVGSEDVHFPESIALATVSVASEKTANLSVPSVNFARTAFSGQERVVVTAGITNRSDGPLTSVPVTLSIDGRELQTVKANIGSHTSASVAFAPFTLSEANVRGSVRAGTDLLPADNTFYFVLAPSAPVSVVIVDNGDRGSASFYLTKALSIGNAPVFQVEGVSAARLTPAALDKASVVVLNDTAFPPAAAGGTLKRFVERGGGLLVVAGERTLWPMDQTDLLPGTIGQKVDRMTGRSGTLGFLDYSHPIFEIFKAPRSGDFSSPHVFQYRTLTVDPAVARVLARYDDGGVAAAERRVGNGRVIAWTSTLDDVSSDLAVKPVFLPLVHQLVRYLARYEQAASWYTVGQVLDLAAAIPGSPGDRLIVTPSGRRSTAPRSGPGLVELEEQGVYEIRTPGATGRPLNVAVNLDPAEADLSPLDPHELVAAVTGRANDAEAQPQQAAALSREDAERRQGLWWYLLLAGLVLLAAETVISNRLSRRERFL
jgi:hypothetical protein